MKKYKYSFQLPGSLKHVIEFSAKDDKEAHKLVEKKIIEMFKIEKL